MVLHPILYWPDRLLRELTKPITVFDDALQALIDAMLETMYAAQGIGLAAPQIGVSKQLAVIDVTPDKSQTWCLINPEITYYADKVRIQEGCLSVPGVYAEVLRALQVQLTALDRKGRPYTIEAEGLLAHCIQHEVDHLQGKLFIDYLSPLKQQIAYRKLNKLKRQAK